MEENNGRTQTDMQTRDGEVYEVSLLDLLVILVKQRKFIIKITALFAVLSIVYALAATPVYKSTLQIMPPGGGGQSGAAAMLAATGMGDLLGSGALATTADTVVGVTKSTAVLDKVIDANGLLTRKSQGWLAQIKASIMPGKGKPKLRTKVREGLAANIDSAADKKSGIVTVSVKDTDPDMAKKLAQSVFDETLHVMQTVAVTPAAQQRAFLEQQIKTGAEDLTKAESDLVAYQRKTGMMGAGAANSSAAALGALQARMVAKDIELRSARRFAKEKNPQVQRLEAEYAAIKKQFDENSAKTGTSPLSGVGLKNLPQASVKYADLIREYQFRENLVLSLQRQYEAAKINEANDPVVVQLLSPPTTPELKDSPKRKKVVVLATLLGAFLGIFLAFIRHFLELSAEDPEVALKLEYVRQALRWKRK